jgi:hypothetical protein
MKRWKCSRHPRCWCTSRRLRKGVFDRGEELHPAGERRVDVRPVEMSNRDGTGAQFQYKLHRRRGMAVVHRISHALIIGVRVRTHIGQSPNIGESRMWAASQTRKVTAMVLSLRPCNAHRSRAHFATLVGVMLVVSGLSGKADAAPKKKTSSKSNAPVAGAACSTLAARAAGLNLDCVKVGTKLQWQPRGTKVNPFRVGETFAWTQSSNQRKPGALISARTITVTEYLPDASVWVSQWADSQPKDIFDAAKGLAVRGVRVIYTLVNATDASSRNFGSLTTVWLGDDRDAGCCSQGSLQWGSNPPAEAIDAYTSLSDGQSRNGVIVFARSDETLGPRPLLRLSWNNADTGNNSAVYFDVVSR